MFEETVSLSPLFFLGSSLTIPYLPKSKKTFYSDEYALPSTSELSASDEFAKLFMTYNEEGIYLFAEVKTEVKKVLFPQFRQGDCLEFFFDTRDLKTRRGVSNFCHHFVFFPEEVNGFFGQEITRFRGGSSRPLCHPKDLKVESEVKPNLYRMTIHIPKFCLHGFDPSSFDRLGFTYRINRTGDYFQDFAIDSEEFEIETHPDLWASCKLEKA